MASKRRRRRRSCLRKQRHKSKEVATAARRALNRKGDYGLWVYRCKFCQGWHVGHRRRS